MPHVDVRRLAAIDMHGTRGTRLRRAVIVAEFTAGAIGIALLGLILATDSTTLGGRLLGSWIAGVGLNYFPLTLHALSLLPGGRLQAELSDVDILAELRHYTVAQFWVTIPLLFVVLAVRQGRGRTASG